MSNASQSRNDRLAPRRFRAPAAMVGAALLALSLPLSVGSALGAAHNNNNHNGGATGTSGNVKVHDAATGVETTGGDNEPHVCDFWLGFTFDAPFEAGTWVLVSWAPTGDGSTITSGAYDTSGDGTDSSDVIDVPVGHYRVEWAATGASASKKKTFWVDAACDEPASSAEESQSEEPAPSIDEPASSAEESQSEEPAPSIDQPASSAEESQSEEPAPSIDQPASPAEESQSEEPSTSSDESPAEEQVTDPSDEPVGDEPSSPAQEPAAEDPGATADEEPAAPADASEEEGPTQAENLGPTDVHTPTAQGLLDGTANGDQPTMSDTSLPTPPLAGGLLAALGVLLLIVAHATARRNCNLDRDLTNGGV